MASFSVSNNKLRREIYNPANFSASEVHGLYNSTQDQRYAPPPPPPPFFFHPAINIFSFDFSN